MSDSKKPICVIVAQEKYSASLARDISTVAVLAIPIAINELTIASGFLSCILALMAFFFIFSRASSEAKGRVIRGDTVDEVTGELRRRLIEEKYE